MTYQDLPRKYANAIINALNELHPEIPTRIVAEDRALFDLGFVDDIPCTLEIDITPEQAWDIWEEVIMLESSAFNYTPEELKDPAKRKEQKQNEEYYSRFAFLEDIMREIMKKEE